MQKILNVYIHRGITIRRIAEGWSISRNIHLYKTLKDAKAAIDKYNDSSNKIEPRIIRDLTKAELFGSISQP